LHLDTLTRTRSIEAPFKREDDGGPDGFHREGAASGQASIAVDFYRTGYLLRVVNKLNGVDQPELAVATQ
jgi:hypothetical protein